MSNLPALITAITSLVVAVTGFIALFKHSQTNRQIIMTHLLNQGYVKHVPMPSVPEGQMPDAKASEETPTV